MDNGDPVAVVLVEGKDSASTFFAGRTAVSYRAQDAAGNVAECNFTVTITDPYPPTIKHCPASRVIELKPEDIVHHFSGQTHVSVSWVQPKAIDNVGVQWSPTSPSQ